MLEKPILVPGMSEGLVRPWLQLPVRRNGAHRFPLPLPAAASLYLGQAAEMIPEQGRQVQL